MGLFDGLISGLLGIGSTAMTNRAQKKENEKQRQWESDEAATNRAFQSSEAAINRDWQSSEAQANRDFQSKMAEEAYDRQVDFYENYQSIGAQMQQYRDAGLNPALLAGGVSPASSAPQSASPSGSMPAGVSTPSGSMGASRAQQLQSYNLDLVAKSLNIEQMKADIDLAKANARERLSTARINEIDAVYRDGVNAANIARAWSAAGRDDAARDHLIEQTVTETLKQGEIGANVRVLNEKVLNLQEDRKLTAKQVEKAGADIQLIGSMIANYDADTKVKGQEYINKTWFVYDLMSQVAYRDQLAITASNDALLKSGQYDYYVKYAEYLQNGMGVQDSETIRNFAQAALNLQKYSHEEVLQELRVQLQHLEIEGKKLENAAKQTDAFMWSTEGKTQFQQDVQAFLKYLPGVIPFAPGVAKLE